MKTLAKYDRIREDLELISEKTRYKILLTLFASEKPLSFSDLEKLLPSVKENKLNHHLKILKDNNFVNNEKVRGYKRDEPRSFYTLNKKSLNLFKKLGISDVKGEFQTLFNKLK